MVSTGLWKTLESFTFQLFASCSSEASQYHPLPQSFLISIIFILICLLLIININININIILSGGSDANLDRGSGLPLDKEELAG